MGNYQKLLADEITLKTIKDEKIELQQRLEPTELGKRKTRLVQELELDEAVYEEEVDDEELLDEVPADEILDEDDEQLDQDLESAGEDEYDEEDASEYGVRGSRRKLKSKAKAESRRKSSGQRSKSKTRGAKRGPKRGKDNDDEDFEEEGLGAEDGDEDDEEDGEKKKKKDETVFIDNLPTTTHEIHATLKEVRKQIKLLEKAFFEEEDSEQEESLKQIANVAKHEEALAAFRENAHLKQFWCIPLSVNVMDFDFA